MLRISHVDEWHELAAMPRGSPLPAPLAALNAGSDVSPADIALSANLCTWGLPLLSIRGCLSVDTPPPLVFELLKSPERRAAWDVLLKEGRLVRQIGPDNAIVHEVSLSFILVYCTSG